MAAARTSAPDIRMGRRVTLRENADQFKGRSSDEWMLRMAAADFVRERGASGAA